MQGFYDGPISGEFDDATNAATIAFQKRNGLIPDGKVGSESIQRARRRGFREAPRYGTVHYTTERNVELSAAARSFAERVANEYYRETGADLTITSGTRTAESQARAMYDNLYRGRNAEPHYRNQQAYREIAQAYEREVRSGASDQDTIDAITRVIQDQVSRGDLISAHLGGRAIDFRSNDMTREQHLAFERAVVDAGGHPRREEDHYHVQF